MANTRQREAVLALRRLLQAPDRVETFGECVGWVADAMDMRWREVRDAYDCVLAEEAADAIAKAEGGE